MSSPTPDFNLNQIGKIQVFIAEDHPAITDSLVERINRNHNMHFVGSMDKLNELTKRLKAMYDNNQRVDVMILDLLMQEGPNGTDVITELNQNYPRTKVIVYSQFNYPDLVENMLKLGAKGYIDKSFGTAVVIDAINRVYEGGIFVRTGPITKPLPAPAPAQGLLPQLTDRQKDILALTIPGLTAKEIAAKLCMKEETVHYHWTRLRSLFDAGSTRELISKVIPVKEQLGIKDYDE